MPSPKATAGLGEDQICGVNQMDLRIKCIRVVFVIMSSLNWHLKVDWQHLNSLWIIPDSTGFIPSTLML